jgi:hypothetical protein
MEPDGEETPPTAQEEEDNALQANIKKKGQYSYYYAHAKKEGNGYEEGEKFEGPGLVAGGPPVLLKS